ncbi:MAG: YHS domain-containing (seleno)protein [Bacteroidota bacterium]
MKSLIAIVLFSTAFLSSAQKIDYNTKKGFVAEGYDVVEYFNNNAKKGVNDYQITHDGVKYKFISEENLEIFKASPTKFIPQYGGYCAYAIAVKNKKVSINPETFEIRDGKLYLFYNSWGTNTLESWLEESPEVLRQKADDNWKKSQ